MKKLFKAVALNKNQNGFSLVEIMVAAGMLGVVSLGVMRLTTNMSKSSKKLYQEAESQDLRNRLKGLLSSTSAGLGTTQTACQNTFAGLTISDAGAVITDIKDKDDNDVMSVGDTIAIGTPGALRITSIRLRGFSTAPSNPRTYSVTSPLRNPFNDPAGAQMYQGGVDLEVQVRKTSNAALTDDQVASKTLGGITKTILVPLNVVTNATYDFQDCFGNQDEYITATCTALGGLLDGNGRCTEVHIFTGAGNAALGGTPDGAVAANIGSALSRDASLANHNSTSLKILRNDLQRDVRALIIDDDEIQAIDWVGPAGAPAVPSTLKINEDGGEVNFGSGDNIQVGVSGTLNVSGNTVIGDDPIADILTVNAVSTFNGNTTVQANTTLNGAFNNIGNEDADVNTIQGETTFIGPLVNIGDGVTDITNITGVTTLTGPTIVVGNQNADTVTIQGTTVLRGNNITVGDNTGDSVTINGTTVMNGGTHTINGNTTLTGTNIVIGNADADNITINGNTRLNGDNIRIGNENNESITVQGVMTLSPEPSRTASDNVVPNLGTVREIIARVLSPEAGVTLANTLADILASEEGNDFALITQSSFTCNRIRIRNKSGGYTLRSGATGCDFDTPDTRCDDPNVCTRVCIGAVCRTSWPSTTLSVTTSCTYPEYRHLYTDVNPSNSNSGNQGAITVNCGANRVVVGMQRQYMRFNCGHHGWRSRMKCCTLSL